MIRTKVNPPPKIERISKEQVLVEKSRIKKIPCFILMADDLHSVEILRQYAHRCKVLHYSPEYVESIDKSIRDFEKWQANNRKQIKVRQ